MKIKDIKVFVCTPGLGKSYLAEIDNRFVDLDREKAIYKYGFDKTISNAEMEKLKGNYGKARNNDSIEYIENRIKKELKENKVLLLAPNPKVVEIINNLNVPYCLIYASSNAKKEVKKRLTQRGNKANFINSMVDCTDEYCKKHREDTRPTFKIEWDGEGYLSDILWGYFGK